MEFEFLPDNDFRAELIIRKLQVESGKSKLTVKDFQNMGLKMFIRMILDYGDEIDANFSWEEEDENDE